MSPHAKHIFKLCLGWFFIVLGLIGLVLPILQGVLFLALGLMILSQESPRARLLRMRLRARFPRAFAKIDAMQGRAHDWWRRNTGWLRRKGARSGGFSGGGASPYAQEDGRMGDDQDLVGMFGDGAVPGGVRRRATRQRRRGDEAV